MKKNEKLLEIIGEADERFIPELEEKKKQKPFMKWAAVGGGVCVAAAIALFVMGGGIGSNPSVDVSGTTTTITLPNTYSGQNTTTTPAVTIHPGGPSGGGFGMSAVLVYDISELGNANPWTEECEISTLPVFKNNAYWTQYGATYLNLEQRKAIASDIASDLGLEIKDESAEYISDITGGRMPEWQEDLLVNYTAYCDGEAKYNCQWVNIDVGGDGTVTINFTHGNSLPEEYSFTYYQTTNEEAVKTLEYLAERYNAVIGYNSPNLNTYADRLITGNQNRKYKVFDSSDDIVESILGYNFSTVEFAPSDSGELMLIRIKDSLSCAEKIDDYPIISLDEAKASLFNGNCITNIPSEYLDGGVITEELIGRTELIYLDSDKEEFFIPYYLFYVELNQSQYAEDYLPEGMKEYGMYYVPAISSEHISEIELYDGSMN